MNIMLQMCRVIRTMPDGADQIQLDRNLLSVIDDSLIRQNRRYTMMEDRLYTLYKKWMTEHDPSMLCAIDKAENTLLCTYEDIMHLYTEREKKRDRLEFVHERMRDKALNICIFKVPHFKETERMDHEWSMNKRTELYGKIEKKVEDECQVRAWDMIDVKVKMLHAKENGWKRYDAERVQKRKYVDQYTTNLTSYAHRILKYPEQYTNEIRRHLTRLNDMNMKMVHNFSAWERERVESERVMGERVMLGQSILKCMNDHVERCREYCQERMSLYNQIHESTQKKNECEMNAKLILCDMYEKRDRFMIKQIKCVEDVFLKGRRERERVQPKNVIVLAGVACTLTKQC